MDTSGTAVGSADDQDLPGLVRRLQQQVDDQQRQLGRLEAALATTRPPAAAATGADAAAPGEHRPAVTPSNPTTPPAPAEVPAADRVSDRRALLRRAGLVAAGAVGGGTALALAPSAPVAANTGDPMVIGANNQGAAVTILRWNGASKPATNGPAVLAVTDSSSGIGTNSGAGIEVMRTVSGATAVLARSNNGAGTGVYAVGGTLGVAAIGGSGSDIGTGVNASGGGVAVLATGTGTTSVGVYSTGARAQVSLGDSNVDITSGGHETGDLVRTLDGDLWLCVAGGLPGTFRKLAGPATAGGLHVLPVPRRVYDSRAGYAPVGVVKGAFTNTIRTIDTRGNASGVPAGATAVLVNLAVTNTVNGGYGTLWASGHADPGTASINWSASGTSTSNSVVTAVDPDGLALCKVAGTADVVIDVIGFYR